MSSTKELPTSTVATDKSQLLPLDSGQQHSASESGPNLGRHRRRCTVCHHPDRELIEQEFLRWRNAEMIAHEFQFKDYSAIYRHAHAFGLFEKRRLNIRSISELFLESAEMVKPSGNTVMQALRAFTQITPDGQWLEPPKRVIVTNIIETRSPEEGTAPHSASLRHGAAEGAGPNGQAQNRTLTHEQSPQEFKTLDIPAQFDRPKNTRIATGTPRSQRRLARQLTAAQERITTARRRRGNLAKRLKTKSGESLIANRTTQVPES